MGLESYLLEICFKNPVPQTDIKDIIESAGASFLAGKSNIEPIDTYRNFYFEIRSDLGLTELYILLAPEKRVVTNFSMSNLLIQDLKALEFFIRSNRNLISNGINI